METSSLRAWEAILRFQRMAVARLSRSMHENSEWTLDDYDVLHQLQSGEGPLQMGDLAERLLVANSSCTRVVARLETAGLVVRQTGSDDRRQVFVSRTAEGRRVWRRLAAQHARDIERVFGAHVSDDEADNLSTIFERLASMRDVAD